MHFKYAVFMLSLDISSHHHYDYKSKQCKGIIFNKQLTMTHEILAMEYKGGHC